MLDVPNSKGRDVRILNLVYVSPDDLITQLRPLLESEGFVIGTDIAFGSYSSLECNCGLF